jgi:hypothetical protein
VGTQIDPHLPLRKCEIILLRHQAASHRSSNPDTVVVCEGAMTYAIHASRDGQSVVTIRISPAVAADKARSLEQLGWQVQVTDSTGHQFDPRDFDRLSSLSGQPA